MEILNTIIYIVELVLFVYLGFAAVYIFIFAFASIFPYRQKTPKNTKNRKFAVLIPGYKEDVVIVDVAKDALNQNYPQDLYDVVIIADSFKAQTIDRLKELPIKLVEVSFDVSTKSKALNKAMQTIGDNYDVALVLDADNLMEKDFIQKVNQSFDNGFMVVQGHRAAKNVNTSFAILDAISEEVNNNIFRKGHRVLGFSSALIGSGMAFDYAFFKDTMSKVNAIGGFDKELELKLLKDKKKIEYLNDAIVLDEKVQKSEVFAKQRKRWLSAQFIYFARYFFPGLYHLFFKGNIDFFDKVYQMISPPRILLLGMVGIISVFYMAVWYFFESASILHFSIQQWMYVLLLVVLAFALSIPRKFYTGSTLRAILSLPRAFFLMFASLFKLKGANKKFIHTEHGVNN
ncbi:glycosyltransferase [Marinifilum caeruleilacunae]|uniref:Glycosyltransferase n=1 Tax=Marinifilum caeruleilacunae TaxID=2499076 RepID=A0ABX1WV39_9BACT|nr:glycosyltransferase family 2 protein [Marinifilum caeruleilacunae]NOU59984.1 glycosyltransferase [Marinifilum caeruleilacunae]